MLEYAITGGTIVDGTGRPPYRGDVGISNGRIAELGRLESLSKRTVDAEGLIVTPGFIDPHTHYDAQLFWDPLATPSSWHGVTTVIAGNCGFTLAPLKARDADYTRRMMAQVEGMPLSSLEQGLPWTWESFEEYLDALEGQVAVNAGFLVGHSALRRYVLGEDFARESTASEESEICQLLDRSLLSGGLGLSTSRSNTHWDGDGHPVPSRWASRAEVLALCGVVGRYDGMSLEQISEGCLSLFGDDEVEFLAQMSVAARSPLNWNVLSVSSIDAARAEHQLRPSARARELGGKIVALTMPVFSDNSVSFSSNSAIWNLPGWHAVLGLDAPEKIRRLQDPAVRAELLDKARTSRMARFADFGPYTIGDVFSQANESYRNKKVSDIAAECGEDPFTTVVRIAVADDLRTVLWPPHKGDDPADWEVRRTLWENPDVLLGGSDAGAHVDRTLGAPYPSRFLDDVLHGRQLVTLERAVQLMTDRPACLFGLRGRGRLAEGYQADVVVFDPEQIGSSPVRTSFDLPGGAKRLVADPVGIVRVLVNGQETIVDGDPTGDLPGTVLRSGRDTTSVMRS